jgi:hypothetical protein
LALLNLLLHEHTLKALVLFHLPGPCQGQSAAGALLTVWKVSWEQAMADIDAGAVYFLNMELGWFFFIFNSTMYGII